MFKIDVLQAHLLCNLRTWSPKPLKKTLKSSKLNNRKHKIYDHPHYKAKRINNKRGKSFNFFYFYSRRNSFSSVDVCGWKNLLLRYAAPTVMDTKWWWPSNGIQQLHLECRLQRPHRQLRWKLWPIVSELAMHL